MTKATDAASKPMYATRDFNDIGTGASFTRGSKIEADAGVIGNYAAAGLASDKKPAAAADETSGTAA